MWSLPCDSLWGPFMIDSDTTNEKSRNNKYRKMLNAIPSSTPLLFYSIVPVDVIVIPRRIYILRTDSDSRCS